MFQAKNVYKWANLFKEEKENVFDEDGPGRPTGARTPAMINSVHDTIQSNRRVKVKNIVQSLNISVGIAHKIFYKDLV